MTTLNRSELFETHEVLAEKIAHKFMKFGKANVEFDDLHQEALISLFKASEKYDPNRSELTFEKFAVSHVYLNVMKWMYRQNYLYTPKNVVEVAATINKKKMKDWDAQEISVELNVPVQYVENALLHLNNPKPRSMDEATPGTEGQRYEEPFYALISDNSDYYNSTIIDFKTFMSQLKPREKTILKLREAGYSQGEIAKKIGVSQVHISRTITKLKNRYNEFSVIS